LALVQSDLKACVIEGCSVVFGHNSEVELRAVIPDSGEASAKFYCADIVGSLIMKGLALYRMKDKDSYDIYAVAGFFGGGPKSASAAFLDSLKCEGFEKVTQNALSEIRERFRTLRSEGPFQVAYFLAPEDEEARERIQGDAYITFRLFLENLA